MMAHHLTKPQKSIWNMEQYFGGSVANITGSALFADKVSVHALQEALNKTVEQNDSLRIRIKTQNGKPLQYTGEFTPYEFDVMRFDTESNFDNWINTLAQTPFSLNGDSYKFFIIIIGNQLGMVMHLHHLTADAWTLSLLVRSVIDSLKGEPATGYSYFDYLAKEQDYESSDRREKDRDYFLSNFEQCREPVYLSNKQTKSIASKRLSFTVNTPDTVKILTFCEEKNISPYSIFMNALAIYIYRIKGAQDFYIGTSVLNRSGKKEKSTAGMYINTVPVLFHMDEGKSSLENVRESTGSIMGVFRHQKYQYSDLLKDIREKYGFKDKLYDVTLNYQNAAFPDGVTSVRWHLCGMQSESLNIHINDRQQEGVFHLDYDYQTELFSKQDIERLHGYLLNIIFDMIENPDKKPHELKLLSDSEYQKVVFDFNDTSIDYPKEKCIHQLFEEQATKTPEAVAVIFEDKEYTYRQINDMADSLACLLRKKGVGRNDIVAIIARRSYKIIVAQLAILKAGGAFMPIDPDYPNERIDFMLGDAKCKTACVLGSVIAAIDSIDMEDDRIFCDNSAAIENINSSEDLCYVIYTSGSTGTPKGTIIKHQSLNNFCINAAYNNMQTAVIKSCNSVLAIGAIIFDINLFEIFLSLLHGLKVIYANEQQANRSNELAQLIIQNKVDCVHITPTRLNSFLSNVHFKRAINQVKLFMIGGEILTAELTRSVRIYSKANIFNGYGPTETTLGVGFGFIKDSSDIHIGKPIANTQIYILDKHSNPVPIGVIGELCISGDGVGLGYLNRPELTAEKFVQNPFIKGSRMYKSGDLARWREDGNIDYIGRSDNQVKIRGLRIELGEIERAITAYTGLHQVVVTDKKDKSGRQFICAFYVSDRNIDEKIIRAELAKKLPRYMIPHFFVRIDTIPTTASGKIDRNSLPVPDFSNIQSDVEHIAPVTDEEKAVVAIMQTVLNTENIGLNDSFFDLGGDSLSAIEFVSKAHYEGIYFSLQDIFSYPTTESLLKHIAEGESQTAQYSAEDFTKIHRLLQANATDEDMPLEKQPLGDILITGATGWLGSHILDEFLSGETGKAYCLVRGADLNDSQNRLSATLENYFGSKYAGCDRIVAICGDITERIDLDSTIGTIIHCAANVKHYGSYRNSYETNVSGTRNVIALAKEKGAKLLYISTISVSGTNLSGSADFASAIFDETKLYIGQPLDNVYVRSKFEAETAVLQAKLDGLDAAVVRVGNLSNRRTDYKFQRNYTENATLARIKAFVDLGLYPEQLADFPLEISPVDDTASAVIKLAQHHNDSHSVFHAYNHKPVLFAEFVKALQAADLKMQAVPTEEFIQAVRNARNIPEKAHIYELFIHIIGEDGRLLFINSIDIKSSFTKWHLKRSGFDWPSVDSQYLQGYVDYFKKMNYWGAEQ